MVDRTTHDPEIDAAVAGIRSRDRGARQRGVETLIRRGDAAGPALRTLAGEADPDVRAAAIYVAAEIGAKGLADVLLDALEDSDPRCRAQAARGLFGIGHPNALDAALRTLDDDPDALHADMTPSVRTLGAIGLRAVPGILDRMLANDEMTRLHAQRALEAVLDRRHGFVAGRGYPSAADEEARRKEWKAQGSYRHDAPVAARQASVALWRRWLEKASE
jgi:HEAT repeat protein